MTAITMSQCARHNGCACWFTHTRALVAGSLAARSFMLQVAVDALHRIYTYPGMMQPMLAVLASQLSGVERYACSDAQLRHAGLLTACN